MTVHVLTTDLEARRVAANLELTNAKRDLVIVQSDKANLERTLTTATSRVRKAEEEVAAWATIIRTVGP